MIRFIKTITYDWLYEYKWTCHIISYHYLLQNSFFWRSQPFIGCVLTTNFTNLTQTEHTRIRTRTHNRNNKTSCQMKNRKCGPFGWRSYSLCDVSCISLLWTTNHKIIAAGKISAKHALEWERFRILKCSRCKHLNGFEMVETSEQFVPA